MNAKKAKPEVGIVMGSSSDWPAMGPTVRTLREFNVPCETRVFSAHRAPRETAEYAAAAAGRGLKVIIAAAGGAAHLAGALAAHTTLPVIGVPLKGGAMDGLDALLSTVQMPAGVPVATVTLGPAGPVNAALLAVQILALQSRDLAGRLGGYKQVLKDKVEKSDGELQAQREKNS